MKKTYVIAIIVFVVLLVGTIVIYSQASSNANNPTGSDIPSIDTIPTLPPATTKTPKPTPTPKVTPTPTPSETPEVTPTPTPSLPTPPTVIVTPPPIMATPAYTPGYQPQRPPVTPVPPTPTPVPTPDPTPDPTPQRPSALIPGITYTNNMSFAATFYPTSSQPTPDMVYGGQLQGEGFGGVSASRPLQVISVMQSGSMYYVNYAGRSGVLVVY